MRANAAPTGGRSVQSEYPTRNAIVHLNYIAVLVTTVAGMMLGWLWYGPLFGQRWIKEMKITPEMLAESRRKGMAVYLVPAVLFTLLSTCGLATLLVALGTPNWKHGAAVGMFVGVFIAAMRQLNTGTWEGQSLNLRGLNAAQEVVLFGLQGAMLGAWH
jgi:hypothetical protein